MMGMESFPEMSDNFHTLVRLSARENIIEFVILVINQLIAQNLVL